MAVVLGRKGGGTSGGGSLPDPSGEPDGDVLTVSSGSAVWSPGGGSQTVLTETVHVSSAQILALHNTPVEITDTPPAGKMIWPISMLFRYNWVTTAYVVVGTADDALYVSTIQEYTIESNGGVWFTQGKLNFMTVPWGFDTVSLQGVAYDDVSVAGGDGHALAIFTQGAGTSLEDGDGTLDITTAYILVDA